MLPVTQANRPKWLGRIRGRVTVEGALAPGSAGELSGAGFSNCVAWPNVLTMSPLAPASPTDPLHFKHYFPGLTRHTVPLPN